MLVDLGLRLVAEYREAVSGTSFLTLLICKVGEGSKFCQSFQCMMIIDRKVFWKSFICPYEA